MNRREITATLHFAATLDSRLRRVLADPQQAAQTIDEWTEALGHIPATTHDGAWDVTQAVRRFYEQRQGDRTARYFACEPHHLLALWAEARSTRMERHTDPLPAAEPDDVPAYRAELLATRHAVASGQTEPYTHPQALNPAAQHQLATATADIGRLAAKVPYVPEPVRTELRAHLPGTRAATPELTVPCPRPSCRAAPLARCTSPQGRELRAGVHGARRDAWAVRTAQCPECAAPRQQSCPSPEPHPARIQAARHQEGSAP